MEATVNISVKKLYGMKNVPMRVPHAMPPRSRSAQHPILLNISFGSSSGPTADFCACSISSILWSTFS